MSALALSTSLLIFAVTPDSNSDAPSGWRGSVSLGAGHDWAGLGLQGEVETGGFAGSVGLGFQGLAGFGLALGARWYPTRMSQGFFVGPHAAGYFGVTNFGAWRVAPWLWAVALTVGYRFQWQHLFFEASVGPALSWLFIGDRGDALPPGWVFSPGPLGPVGPDIPAWLIPDVGLALGWRF